MKLLSIIIPYFNTDGELFSRCISSLSCENRERVEVIIVDDGSSDASKQSLSKVTSRFEGDLAVLHKDNGGQNSARVHGLVHSCGKYVLFMDSDDYVSTSALDAILNVLLEKAPSILCYNYDTVDVEGNIIDRCLRYGPGYDTADFSKEVIRSGALWKRIYRRDILDNPDDLMVQGIRIGEDLGSSVRILLSAGESSSIGISLYRYVAHQGSAVSNPPVESMFDILKAFDWMLGIPADRTAPFHAELEWLSILHVLFYNGNRVVTNCGPDDALKRAMFEWMKCRFPEWKTNDYLKSEQIAKQIDFKLLTSGFWRAFYVQDKFKRFLRRVARKEQTV